VEKPAFIMKLGELSYPSGQCCGSGMFILDPGSDFFYPGSSVDKILDLNPHQMKVF